MDCISIHASASSPVPAGIHAAWRVIQLRLVASAPSTMHPYKFSIICIARSPIEISAQGSCFSRNPLTGRDGQRASLHRCIRIRTRRSRIILLQLAVFVTCASCVVPRGWAVFYQALPSSVVAWHAHDLRVLLQSCYRVIRIRPRLANNPALYAFDVRNTAYGYTRIQRRCCIWIDAQRPGDDVAHRAGRFDSAGGVTVSMCK